MEKYIRLLSANRDLLKILPDSDKKQNDEITQLDRRNRKSAGKDIP